MTDPANADRQALRRDMDQIEMRIRTYSEHGLFGSDAGAVRTAALAKLEEARTLLAEEKLVAAWRSTVDAETLLHQQVAKSKYWRLTRLHQLPLTAWLLFLFLVLVNWSTGWLPILPPLAPEVFGVSTTGPILGALGAILRSIWWMHRQIAREQYRLLFLNAHVVSPAIGALFGLFVYQLLAAGLLLVQGAPSEPDAVVIAPALAFLAGYNWDWISEQLDKLFSDRGGAAAKPTPAEEQSNPPTAPHQAASTNGQQPLSSGAPRGVLNDAQRSSDDSQETTLVPAGGDAADGTSP